MVAEKKTGNINIKRYKKIMSVLMKNGLGFLFVKSALSQNPQKMFESHKKFKGKLIGERIRLCCEELGPTFVKLGQILSTQTDFVPPHIAEELEQLQDHVPPFSFDVAKELIEGELQDSIENIFEEFEEKPIASASISQVYRAKLKSGKVVAVKIQRPNLKQTIEIDINILAKLARFIGHHSKYGKLYDFEGMVGELKKVMEQEINFIIEGENLDRFNKNVSTKSNINAPKVRWSYTTQKVLTMDFVDGIKINDTDSLAKIGADQSKLAQDFTRSLLRQILVDGFFHADPHPGNVMITNNGTEVTFIDLGMMGVLNDHFKRLLTSFVVGLATQNTSKIAHSIMEMDTSGANVNQYQFAKSLEVLLDEYLYSPISQVNVSQVFSSVFALAAEYHMKIPRELTLVAKSLGTAQNILETLDPKANILSVAEEIINELALNTLFSKQFSNEIKSTGIDITEIFRSIPSFFLKFMRKTEKNDFAIELKLPQLEKFERSLERMANHISFTIILLAVCMVLAGIVITIGFQARTDSGMYNLSVYTLRGGIIIAAAIIVGLLISIVHTNSKRD